MTRVRDMPKWWLKYRATRKRWYRDHKEEVKAQSKLRYQATKKLAILYGRIRGQQLNGWSSEEFEETLYAQDCKCAICGKQFEGEPQVCADHCHKTGRRRELLCNFCNSQLGIFEKYRELFEVKFPAYIERWSVEHTRLDSQGSMGRLAGNEETEKVASDGTGSKDDREAT